MNSNNIILKHDDFLQKYSFLKESIDLDIIKSKLGLKNKIETPEGILVKVKGDSIDSEEIKGFFQTIYKYLEIIPVSRLRNKNNEISGFEYTKMDNGRIDTISINGKVGSNIDIDYGGGRVVFKRKEGEGSDKIKLVLKSDFLEKGKTELLNNFIENILEGSEVEELSSNYNDENDEIDIIASKLGKKNKIKSIRGIKVKVKGDTISEKEIIGFFNTIYEYIDLVGLSKLRNTNLKLNNDFEYKLDINDRIDNIYYKKIENGSSIDIDYGGGRVVFKRKEGEGSDKLKLIILPNYISNGDEAELLNLLKEIGSTDISSKLVSNFNQKEEDKKISKDEKKETEFEKTKREFKEEVNNNIDNTTINKPRVDSFVNFFISQKLAVPTFNSDEQKIFEFIINNNELNAATVDSILINYRKNNTNSENKEEFISKISRFVTRNEYVSNGLVQDLLYAFEGGETSNKKIKAYPIISKHLKEINDKTATNIKNNLTNHLGMIIGGGALWYMGTKFFMKAKNFMSFSKGMTSKRAVFSLAKSTGTKIGMNFGKSLLGIGFRGLLGSIGLWIGVAGSVYEIWNLYQDSAKEQQYQVAYILFMLHFSGSKMIQKEMIEAGIDIKDLITILHLQKVMSNIQIEEKREDLSYAATSQERADNKKRTGIDMYGKI